MGTSEFAVASLDAIVQAGHDVAAVVTVPDKPAGRGQQLRFSDVKNYALEHQLPVLQPEKLKDPAFVDALRQLAADVFVVVAFRMLPEIVYSMPPQGTFNIHASLLPQYRGAAPINWAVINGEKETGVTAFFLNREIDKGDIIAQSKVTIGEEESAGELHDRLMVEGAALAVQTLAMIEQGRVTTLPQPQTDDQLKPAPKIFREDMLINWDQPAQTIHDMIRGLSPYPAAYTRIQDKNGETYTIKCFQTKVLAEKSTNPPGTVNVFSRKNLVVSAKDVQILLQNIQFQGKKRMNSEIFLSGFRLENYILKFF